MRPRSVVAIALLTGLWSSCLDAAAVDPMAVAEERAELAERIDFWPGFDPLSVPLVLYDGESTYLFAHPSPPPAFKPHPSHEEVWVMAGRHPQIVANYAVDIGDTVAAVVMLKEDSVSTVREEAAIVLHECFHAFQR
ncbi:MAG: hypothetical protein GF355_14300, partial [Candidatus Eisenbacteria bacterium]|nr:hypothetical protein [Candidatus Eisenbacteria bacterium]